MAIFNLYEFPSDYVGRKTYVHVGGHSRSVPKMYTYRGTDGLNHVHPDYGGDWSGVNVVDAPMVMSDMAEYVSPLDRSVVSSRSQHREHIRQHGVIEVGNQPIGSVQRQEAAPLTRAGYDIARAMQNRR